MNGSIFGPPGTDSEYEYERVATAWGRALDHCQRLLWTLPADCLREGVATTRMRRGGMAWASAFDRRSDCLRLSNSQPLPARSMIWLSSPW